MPRPGACQCPWLASPGGGSTRLACDLSLSAAGLRLPLVMLHPTRILFGSQFLRVNLAASSSLRRQVLRRHGSTGETQLSGHWQQRAWLVSKLRTDAAMKATKLHAPVQLVKVRTSTETMYASLPVPQ